MKKVTISFIISIIMMFSLCACGGKNNANCKPDLNKSFCITAHIEYDSMTADAVFKRIGRSNWDVEFSTPNTLAGVLLSFRDTNVEASYKGLMFSVPKSALPLKSIISSFIEIVDEIAEQPEITGEEKDNEIINEGETELGKYIIKFDKNGVLTGFEMANLNLVITFSEFCDNNDVPQETSETEITEATISAESTENSEATDSTEISETTDTTDTDEADETENNDLSE